MKILSVLLILIFLSGCATPGINLVEDGTTEVEMLSSKKMSVIKVNVNQTTEQTTVKGLVVRDNKRRFAKGFVTVDLYNQRGVRIDSVDAKVSYARRGSKSARQGRFKAELEEIVPVNSRVVVRPHDKRLDTDKKSGSMSIL